MGSFIQFEIKTTENDLFGFLINSFLWILLFSMCFDSIGWILNPFYSATLSLLFLTQYWLSYQIDVTRLSDESKRGSCDCDNSWYRRPVTFGGTSVFVNTCVCVCMRITLMFVACHEYRLYTIGVRVRVVSVLLSTVTQHPCLWRFILFWFLF